MDYRARIEINLKPGHSDPEGETTKRNLKDLEYAVKNVRTIKVYEVFLKADSLEEAEKKVGEMCVRLLANPVKDNYSYKVVKDR